MQRNEEFLASRPAIEVEGTADGWKHYKPRPVEPAETLVKGGQGRTDFDTKTDAIGFGIAFLGWIVIALFIVLVFIGVLR